MYGQGLRPDLRRGCTPARRQAWWAGARNT